MITGSAPLIWNTEAYQTRKNGVFALRGTYHNLINWRYAHEVIRLLLIALLLGSPALASQAAIALLPVQALNAAAKQAKLEVAVTNLLEASLKARFALIASKTLQSRLKTNPLTPQPSNAELGATTRAVGAYWGLRVAVSAPKSGFFKLSAKAVKLDNSVLALPEASGSNANLKLAVQAIVAKLGSSTPPMARVSLLVAKSAVINLGQASGIGGKYKFASARDASGATVSALELGEFSRDSSVWNVTGGKAVALGALLELAERRVLLPPLIAVTTAPDRPPLAAIPFSVAVGTASPTPAAPASSIPPALPSTSQPSTVQPIQVASVVTVATVATAPSAPVTVPATMATPTTAPAPAAPPIIALQSGSSSGDWRLVNPPAQPLSYAPAWNVALDGKPIALMTDGASAFALSERELICVRLETGAVEWRKPFPTGLSMTVTGGRLLLLTPGKLLALDATGREVGSVNTSALLLEASNTPTKPLVLLSGNDSLLALDPITLEPVYEVAVRGVTRINVNPISGSGLLELTSGVQVFNLATGELQAKLNYKRGALLDATGLLLELNLRLTILQADFRREVDALLVGTRGDHVFMNDIEDRLYCFSLREREFRWSTQPGLAIYGFLALDNQVFIALERELQIRRTDTGAVTQRLTVGKATQLLVSNASLLAFSASGLQRWQGR